MPCQLDSFKNADTIIEDSGIDIYPTEHLNPIDVSNLPPHGLDLNLRGQVTQVRSMHTTGRIVFIPRILLAPSAYDLEIEQMDIVTAFLANLLDEKINTEQPEGFTEGRIKFGSWKKVFMD